MVQLICGFCGKLRDTSTNSNTPMMQCGKCKVMNYCSRECQVQHWEVHKSTCRITTKTKRDMAVQDSKRLVRLFTNWIDGIIPHPLDSLLDAYYGCIRLKNEIRNKKVIEIETAFDYNRLTFVPKCPPRLLDINSYRLDHPKHDLSNPDVVVMSLQLRDAGNQGRGVHIFRAVSILTFYLAPWATSGRPWDEIVEQVFPYTPPPAALPGPFDDIAKQMYPGFNNNSAQPASLQSSIFLGDSWETIKQNNLEQQCELVRQSPHYGQFISNALYIKTMQPRYKTHVVMVHVKLGMGLGQWSQLKDYQVLSMVEAKQLLHKRRRTSTRTTTTVAVFDHMARELLDLETQTTTTTTHPETTLLTRQNDNDNNDPNPNSSTTTNATTIRVPILFDVQVDDFVMIKPFSFRIPTSDISSMSGCCVYSDTKTHEYFDELMKETISSFPTVVSPNLH